MLGGVRLEARSSLENALSEVCQSTTITTPATALRVDQSLPIVAGIRFGGLAAETEPQHKTPVGSVFVEHVNQPFITYGAAPLLQ